ncbi:MAG: TetR/AcrR family transcriptional regulator [Opitutaceae bacterium]|jgi:TetR/AcrR family transcriptional repressor of nem operon|nr:TetR/AcrR family transcriptional regulator [Opitutaceae bacterium]
MGRTSDAKARLMAATLDLMWEQSYGTITVDDICRRADVRKGSFYHFFPGKAELAVAAIDEMWRSRWKPFLDEHLSVDKEPLRRFQDYFQALVTLQAELARDHGKVLGCPLCSVGNEVSTHEADVGAAIREIFAKKRRYYESAIRDAVAAGAIAPCDPAETATALFALIDGLLTQARIMNDLKILKHLPARGLELLKARAPAATSTRAR